MAMKYCSSCDTLKPPKQFHKAKHRADGRAHTCATCSRERTRITNKALAVLRDRHYDEYLQLRQQIAADMETQT